MEEAQMVRKLGTVMLTVADIDRSAGFYGDALGLEIQRHSDDWAQADAGGTAIGLHRSDDPQAGSGFALIFDVDDVGATYRALTERGIEGVEEPHEQPYGEIATVTDPDGHVVQLFRSAY
jgi:predicted enzyme related to lactoylglutathione lyase